MIHSRSQRTSGPKPRFSLSQRHSQKAIEIPRGNCFLVRGHRRPKPGCGPGGRRLRILCLLRHPTDSPETRRNTDTSIGSHPWKDACACPNRRWSAIGRSLTPLLLPINPTVLKIQGEAIPSGDHMTGTYSQWGENNHG